MGLRATLSWVGLRNVTSVSFACLVTFLFTVVSAPASEDGFLWTNGPSPSLPAGFTLKPKDPAGPGALALWAREAEAAPAAGKADMTRVATDGAFTSSPSLSYRLTLVDTRPSPALILVNGTPTATMTEDEPQVASNESALIRPSEQNGTTRVNVLTGLGTVSGQEYTPLTREQRWRYYLNQNFTSLGAIVGPALSSLIDQAGAQPPEWGGGMPGYGKRLVSRLGTGMVMGTVQSAGCALLGQEPRYVSSSSTNVFARIGHGFLFSFITYNNEGNKRIALATLTSYYAASMTATLWMPGRYTALGDGVRDGTRQVILAGFINQWQEFWPEIRRHILRRP